MEEEEGREAASPCPPTLVSPTTVSHFLLPSPSCHVRLASAPGGAPGGGGKGGAGLGMGVCVTSPSSGWFASRINTCCCRPPTHGVAPCAPALWGRGSVPGRAVAAPVTPRLVVALGPVLGFKGQRGARGNVFWGLLPPGPWGPGCCAGAHVCDERGGGLSPVPLRESLSVPGPMLASGTQ